MSGFLYLMLFVFWIASFVLLIIALVKKIKKKPAKVYLFIAIGCFVAGIVSVYVGSEIDPQNNCSHEYEVIEDREATCTEDGIFVKECPICGKKVREVREATGHKLVETKRINPTGNEDGQIVEVCSICGYEQITPIPRPTDESTKDVEPIKETVAQSVKENIVETGKTSNNSQSMTSNSGTVQPRQRSAVAEKAYADAVASGCIKPIYEWDYPALFSKDRQKIFTLLAQIDEFYYSFDEKGDLKTMEGTMPIRIDKKTFVQTLDTPDYQYYGEVKDNKPNGLGVLISPFSNLPIYAGYFKKGIPSGFGMKFYSNGVLWESEDASFDGEEFTPNKKTIYYYEHTDDNSYYHEERKSFDDKWAVYHDDEEWNKRVHTFDEEFRSTGVFFEREHLVLRPLVYYEGNTKNGVFNGKGCLYYDICSGSSNYGEATIDIDKIGSCYGPIWYDTEFKNGKIQGKGKQYDYQGTLRYEGEFKDNKMDGKGTLYKADGSIEYKGKFKNGDIAK